MGLFGTRFNRLESALVDQYAQAMVRTMGFNPPEARKQAKDAMLGLIKQSREDGTYGLPNNLGDLILGDATTRDPIVLRVVDGLRKKIPKKREEGVRDADVRWWWNLREVERRWLVHQDDVARLALVFHVLRKREETPSEQTISGAAKVVHKTHPTYGDSDDLSIGAGDDRPLPYELKDRINIYIGARASSDPEAYKQEMEASSSFNALVRREIRAGNI